jgi:hypothetical protein
MADTVPLSVKWGKETIDLSFVVAGGVKGLKTELEEKTRVPADRMKLMAKSKGKSLFFSSRLYRGKSLSRRSNLCSCLSFILNNPRSLEGCFER